jgi:hypothetical protein
VSLSPEEWRRALALSRSTRSSDDNELLNQYGQPARSSAAQTQPGRFDQHTNEQQSDQAMIDKLLGSKDDDPRTIANSPETMRALQILGGRAPSVEVGPIETKTREPSSQTVREPSASRVDVGPISVRGQGTQYDGMTLPETQIVGDPRSGGLPPNPYEDDPLAQALRRTGSDPARVLGPRAQAASDNYQTNYHPEKATGRDNGYGRQMRDVNVSNDETAALQAMVRSKGGGDLGMTERDERQPLVNRVPPPNGDAAIQQHIENLDRRNAAEAAPQAREPLRADATSRELNQQLAEGRNREIDVVGHRGDAASEMGAQAAELAAQRRAELKGGLDKSLQRVDQNNTQRDAFAARARAHLANISGLANNAPEEKGGALRMIASIVGGMPGAGGIGHALGALSGSMGETAGRYKQQLGAQQAAYAATSGAMQDLDANSESEMRINHAISQATYLQYNAALDQFKAEADSKSARQSASELQEHLQNGYVDSERAWKAVREDIARKLGKDEKEQKAEDYFHRLDLGDLQEGVDHGRYANSSKATEVLQARKMNAQKVVGGELDITDKRLGIDKTNAEIKKLNAEAAGGGKMTEAERKNDNMAQGIAGPTGPYARLDKMVQAAGGDPTKMDMPRWGIGGPSKDPFGKEGIASSIWNAVAVPEEHQQFEADSNALAEAVLRAESGATITDSDMAQKKAALGIDSSDEKVRARALMSLLQRARAIDDRGRLTAGSQAGGGVRFTADKGR